MTDGAIFPAPDGTEYKLFESFKYDTSRCPHTNVEIDEDLANLTCQQCGVELNPITYLAKLVKERCVWAWQKDELDKARRRYEAKKTTRCEHCNRVTRVTEPREGLHHFQETIEPIKPSTAPRLVDEDSDG